MKHIRTCAGCGLGVVAILIGPIIVIFLSPLAIVIGFDIFDLFGETPFALALSGPLAFVLLRRALPLSHSTEMKNYAPKSVSVSPTRCALDQLVE